MTAMMIGLAALVFTGRLRVLRRVWQLPKRNGKGFFLAQEVGPDFYETAGARLFQRYHRTALLPLFLDAPLAAWLVLGQRYAALGLEQVLALVLSIIAYNFMVPHFSALATSLCGHQERPAATTLQLSMAPRRLSDYTSPAVEAVIVGATLLAFGLLARSYALSQAANGSYFVVHAFRSGAVVTVWVLYWQVGFLLLKGVFIRRRMPLPANRTEDFRRWRMAWLNHNLKIFDAVRIFCAISLAALMAWTTYGRELPRAGRMLLLGVGGLGLLVYAVYVVREERRLAATERELKPVEMVKEFPRFPVAEGRYLAGGLLYFNRENPWVLVRSAQGIALNVAHRTTYIGAAYLTGLIALAIWMARLAR